MAERPVIIDTGPLVAVLDERDHWHHWAVSQVKLLPAPFLTCEPVLTETFHLLSRTKKGPQQFFELLKRGVLGVDFVLTDHTKPLENLVHKYRDLPMSLADACLVRLSEIHPSAAVLTLDHHFRIYRRNGRQAIPLLIPEK